MAKDDGVVPSGSVSVNDVPGDDQDTTPAGGDDKGRATEDKVYAGKYKSAEDLEKGYSELEQKLNHQGNELGQLRKQSQELIGQLAQMQQQSQNQNQTPAPNDMLKNLIDETRGLDLIDDEQAQQKFVDNISRALQVTAQMSKEDAFNAATAKFNEILQERDSQAMTNAFLEQNPDFQELQNQGVFQAMKTKNPMHDDFSAYHAYKAQELAQKTAELQAQLEEAQKIANLAGGDEAASKVFTKSAGSVRTATQAKPKNLSELKAGAVAALRAARGG